MIIGAPLILYITIVTPLHCHKVRITAGNTTRLEYKLIKEKLIGLLYTVFSRVRIRSIYFDINSYCLMWNPNPTDPWLNN